MVVLAVEAPEALVVLVVEVLVVLVVLAVEAPEALVVPVVEVAFVVVVVEAFLLTFPQDHQSVLLPILPVVEQIAVALVSPAFVVEASIAPVGHL